MIRPRIGNRRAFTVIELLVVVAIVGIMAAMVVPRLRVTPKMHARIAARQFMRDAELVRNRALSLRRAARLQISTADPGYRSYGDHDNNGAIAGNDTELLFLRASGARALEPGVVFGRGNASGGIPGEAGAGAVTFTNERIEFDTRGMPTPFGTKGTVYFTATGSPETVFAVQITGAGSFKLWEYLPNGTWQ
jgi:prepilin-type N-terminal cleavage/methylation domain-containing protein